MTTTLRFARFPAAILGVAALFFATTMMSTPSTASAESADVSSSAATAAQAMFPPGTNLPIVYISPNGDLTFQAPNGDFITVDIYGNVVAINGSYNLQPVYAPAPGPGGFGSSNDPCPLAGGAGVTPVYTPNGVIYARGAGGWTSNGPWSLTTCVAAP